MPKKTHLVFATLPEFEALVPENVYNEATISLGILEQGVPSGVICLFYEDLHYTISWLFVKEDARNKGLGRELLEGMTRTVRKLHEVYPIDVTFTSTDRDFLGLFQSYEHFDVRSVGHIYTIPADKRRESALFMHLLKANSVRCDSFFSYDKKKQERFFEKLAIGSPELADFVNSDLNRFEKSLSLAYGENGIRAVIFAEVHGTRIDINALYSEDLAALSMLLAAGAKRIEHYYKDYSIRVVCFHERTELLVRRFFRTEDIEFLLEAKWDMRLPGEYPGNKKSK